MIIGILAYTLTWFIAWLLLLYRYQYAKNIIRYELNEYIRLFYKKKMPIIIILIISGMFTLFNYYVTVTSTVTGGDRQNYILNFNGYRDTPSIGLGFMMNFVHFIGGNIITLYCITTFICVFITLIAYRESDDATPYSFYLLCLTQYFLATLTALKQSYASAFAVLFFVLIIEKNTKKSRILSIFCIVMACLFHPTGFILIPLFLMLQSENKKKNVILYFFLLLVMGVFFEQVMVTLGTTFSSIVPSLGSIILNYFVENQDVTDGIAISFLKGAPYYFITLLGIVERRRLINKVKNYDKYLLTCSTGAFLYMVSLYSVWLGRFVYFFSFVSFVFYVKIIRMICFRGNRLIYNFFLQASLAFVTYRFLYLVYSLYGGF